MVSKSIIALRIRREQSVILHTITLLSHRLYDAGLCQYHTGSIYFLSFYAMKPSTDKSIQANLRNQALNKKASHRNWREWDALYDFEVSGKYALHRELIHLKNSMPRFGISMVLLGISTGMLLSRFLPMILEIFL